MMLCLCWTALYGVGPVPLVLRKRHVWVCACLLHDEFWRKVCSLYKDLHLATTRDNHRNGDEMLCPWNTRNTFQLLTGVYSEQYGLQNDSIYAGIRLSASSKCIQYFRMDDMIFLDNLCLNLLIWSLIWSVSCSLLIRRIQGHRHLIYFEQK